MTKERTSLDYKLNIPILIAVIVLFISTVLIIITFAVIYWLYNLSNGDNYGMWQGCSKNTLLCARWYDNGQISFFFPMTDSFKAFQGLQVIFLVTLFCTVLTLFTNMHFFPLNFWFYVVNCSIIFVSNVCAIASLLVFVVNVYDSKKHILGWCYWVQVGVIVANFITLIIVCVQTIRLKQPMKEVSQLSLITNDSNQIQQESKKFKPITNQVAANPSITNELNVKNINKNNNKISTPRTPHQFRQNINRTNTGSFSPRRNKALSHHKRYNHKHLHSNQEQFQPGYSSEPDFIEYSLDRSWINNHSFDDSTIKNTNIQAHEFETKIEREMLNVKLPRLVYYDGYNHYARSDFKKISK